MGNIIPPSHNTQHNNNLLLIDSSQHKLQLQSSANNATLRNIQSAEFQFSEQTLSFLSRQEIVQNNFSEEFDPLFTIFRPSHKNNYGKFRILCSNITNEKIQEYRLLFRNQAQLRTYLVSYFWRKSINPTNEIEWPLVRTTNFKISEESKVWLRGGLSAFLSRNCSQRKQILCNVYVQDVPLRLCHIKDIPFPQNLYVLQQALKGFRIVYENIGYIKPFEDLICITRKGIVKVWINSELSRNYPNIENIEENLTSEKTESKLVNQVLQLVNSNTDPEEEPISFLNYLKHKHVNSDFITFQKVFQMINKYSVEFQVPIPNVFGSIVEVLNQEEQEYDTYRTDMDQPNDDREKEPSSRFINKSNHRSSSGLFLDVPNQSQKLKCSNPVNSSSSNIDSKRQKQRSSKRYLKQKTQSLNEQQNEHNSRQSSSIDGIKANNVMSESMPVSMKFKQQEQINILVQEPISTINHNLVDDESRQRFRKLSDANFLQSVRKNSTTFQHEEDNKKDIILKSSIPVNRATSEIIIQKTEVNEQKLKTLSKYKQLGLQVRATFLGEEKVSSKERLAVMKAKKEDFIRNKKTYSNLWQQRVELDDQMEKSQSEFMGQRESILEVTAEELEHMKQIDRYLEEQVMEDSRKEKNNSSIRPSLQREHSQQGQQFQQEKVQFDHTQKRASANMSNQNRQDQHESRFQEGSNVRKQQTPKQGLETPSKKVSSLKKQYLEDQFPELQEVSRVENKVKLTTQNLKNKTQNSSQSGQDQNKRLLNQHRTIIIKHQNDFEQSSLEHSQNQPNIQANFISIPAKSFSMHPNHQSFRNVGHSAPIPSIQQNANQEQPENRTSQLTSIVASATSIGNNVQNYNPHHVHYIRPLLSRNNNVQTQPIAMKPMQPKVRFMVCPPEVSRMPNSENSFKQFSEQVIFSQDSRSNNFHRISAVQHTNHQQNNHQVYGLGSRANTTISGYANSQGNHSRKFYKQDSNSSLCSKPSLVQYSYSRNLEMIKKDSLNKQNPLILESSKVNSQSHFNLNQKEAVLQMSENVTINTQKTFNYIQKNNFEIIPIPEEIHSFVNNSRSLLNDVDEYNIQLNPIQLLSQNVESLYDENTLTNQTISQQREKMNPFPGRQQVRIIETDLEELSFNGKQNQKVSPFRQQAVFMSVQHSPIQHRENPFPSPSPKRNIRSSYQSSSSDEQPHRSVKSPKESFQNQQIYFSANKKKWKAEDEKYKQKQTNNQNAKNGCRIVESIEGNRTRSAYQFEIDELEGQRELPLDSGQSYNRVGSKQLLGPNRFSGVYTPGYSLHPHSKTNIKASHQASQQKNNRQDIKKLPNKPITGRTIFLNLQNQQTSEFVDASSEIQSEVDYTYNSYDKWKDKNKEKNCGPSKSRHEKSQLQNPQHKIKGFNLNSCTENKNLPLESSQRDRQLIKSSIEGTIELINHNFVNFKTEKKRQQDQKDTPNQVQQFYVFDRKNYLGLVRMSKQYDEEEIDAEILKDLKAF